MEYYVKNFIIQSIDLMVLEFVFYLTLTAFIVGWTSVGFFGALGFAVIGFVASCMMAGTWFLFTMILERLKSNDKSLKK